MLDINTIFYFYSFRILFIYKNLIYDYYSSSENYFYFPL